MLNQISLVLSSIFFSIIASILYSFISNSIYGDIASLKYLVGVSGTKKDVKRINILLKLVGYFILCFLLTDFVYWLLEMKNGNLFISILSIIFLLSVLFIQSHFANEKKSYKGEYAMATVFLIYGLLIIALGIVELFCHMTFEIKEIGNFMSTIVIILGVVICALSELIFLVISMRKVIDKKTVFVLNNDNQKGYLARKAYRKIKFENGYCIIKIGSGRVSVVNSYDLFIIDSQDTKEIEHVKKLSKLSIVEL